MSAKSRRTVALLLATCAISAAVHAAPTQEAQNLNELRNTVVNLLQTLVERGIVTREQAEAMVSAAQKKAEADAAAVAAQEQAEAGAVRVPYVPEIVKEEIRKQVAADLGEQVTRDVIEQAHSEQWGVPGALPDWVQRVRWTGDVRVRGEDDEYASTNLPQLNFLAVNDGGGIDRAGVNALANTSEDRYRMRARLRFGLEAELGWGWSLGGRLASGNLRDPVSTNQTLGNTGARYQTAFDLGYAKWNGNSATGKHVFTAWAGRIPNPWLGTDLVWDPDLTFEGVASTYRLGLMRDDPYSHFLFLTLGAFPLQEVELSTKDKWLFGAQTGIEWKFQGGSRFRFGVAYYQYDNIVGQRNTTLESHLLDFTAPQFMQKGNTLFDIRNTTDTSANLFALAADYHLANATLNFDWKVAPLHRVALVADYVRNVGYKESEVLARGPLLTTDGRKRVEGYSAELNFGSTSMALNGAWRTFIGYRYLQRDAVLDAFTDSDFHLGGTDAKGYFIGADYAFTQRVLGRLRYLSASEIDGPPLGVDVLQLDLTASF